MIAFALYNLKGGVGKTTSCVNLAYLAAKEGHRVLVWDIDPQSSATFYLRKSEGLNGKANKLWEDPDQFSHLVEATDYENLFIIRGDLRNRNMDVMLSDLEKSKSQFKKMLKTIKNQFDYVFIDCPPVLGLLAENVFRSAHFVLLPLIPTTLSERALSQVNQFFVDHAYDTRKIVPFFTQVDSRKKLHKEIISSFKDKRLKHLRSSIPYSSTVEKMGINQAPIHSFSPSSIPSQAYRNLWQELKWLRKLKQFA
jgi:cellulose biosynthesis protein BcsQ